MINSSGLQLGRVQNKQSHNLKNNFLVTQHVSAISGRHLQEFLRSAYEHNLYNLNYSVEDIFIVFKIYITEILSVHSFHIPPMILLCCVCRLNI